MNDKIFQEKNSNFDLEIDNEFELENDAYETEVDNKVWINELLEGIELD